MREVEIPPPSASIEHFRLEVSRRAAHLAQRRRRMVGGAVTAVLLVVLAASLVELGPGHPGARRVVAGPTTTTRGPTTTSGGTLGARLGPSGPRSVPPQSGATAPQPTAADAAVSPVQLLHPPSGTTSSLTPGREATVVLAAPGRGRWGGALVTKGRDSVLAFVRQASDPHGGVQVTFRALKNGVADVTVPCLGHPAGSWHGTVKVTSGATPPG